MAITSKKLRLSPQTTANLSEVVSSLRDSVWKTPTKNKENEIYEIMLLLSAPPCEKQPRKIKNKHNLGYFTH